MDEEDPTIFAPKIRMKKPPRPDSRMNVSNRESSSQKERPSKTHPSPAAESHRIASLSDKFQPRPHSNPMFTEGQSRFYAYRKELERPYDEQDFTVLPDVPIPPQASSTSVIPNGHGGYTLSLRNIDLNSLTISSVDDSRDLGFLDHIIDDVREENSRLNESLDLIPSIFRGALRSMARLERREPIYREIDSKCDQLEALAHYSAALETDLMDHVISFTSKP